MYIFRNQLKRVTILISQSHISQVSTPGASELVTKRHTQKIITKILKQSIFGIFLINPLGGKQLFSYQVWDGCGVIRYLIEVLKTQRGGCLKIFKIIECILDIRLRRKKEYWYVMLMEVKSRIFDGSSQFKSHN